MTRNQIKQKIINIMEDGIDIEVWDDSGLYMTPESLERTAEEIMKLWDKGFTYDLPFEDRSGESMNETLNRMRYK